MQKSLTAIFYGSVALAASIGFSVLLLWGLQLNSSIATLIANTYPIPFYFWPYALLTFGSIILFGVNAALLTWRVRKFGMPKLRRQTGTGIGSLTGLAASACPVCGSTLLAAVGISGGLAAFPLGGLELKVLAFLLLAVPLILILREKRLLEQQCKDGVCPLPADASFKENDGPVLATVILLIFVFGFWGLGMLGREGLTAGVGQPSVGTDTPALAAMVEKVIPEAGFQSKIRLGDAMPKLIRAGVIDPEKLEALYQDRGGVPEGPKNGWDKRDSAPILLTRENAGLYLNLLWPIGLSNRMEANTASPVNGPDVFNFASTAGWTLGKTENGGEYFNKVEIVRLTPDEEALVKKIAENSYRPCCNNSTFFQDCNHGSALLGLLELGASQGLSESELWREALAFNAYWFPGTYVNAAIYFEKVKGIAWEDADPKTIMGKEFSSASGAANVQQTLGRMDLLPNVSGGGGCGV